MATQPRLSLSRPLFFSSDQDCLGDDNSSQQARARGFYWVVGGNGPFMHDDGQCPGRLKIPWLPLLGFWDWDSIMSFIVSVKDTGLEFALDTMRLWFGVLPCPDIGGISTAWYSSSRTGESVCKSCTLASCLEEESTTGPFDWPVNFSVNHFGLLTCCCCDVALRMSENWRSSLAQGWNSFDGLHPEGLLSKLLEALSMEIYRRSR